MTYKFERGVPRDNPAWEELFELLDKHCFTTLDMLACVCANLCGHEDKEFKTKLMCGGHEFKVKIKKKIMESLK